ncbi:MAG: DNA repair protein RecO [Cyclobacteriaceae bacterium]
MIFKTRGIVFRFTKFGETSIIVTIFTEQFGLQSYMVNGVRSKSARNKIALYQPLTLLNLVVYHREHANIERIKEISCLHPYGTLTADVKKSTLAMFINELLNKTVKDESHGGEIFQFLFESLISLDSLQEGYENFHLIFMLKLARHLGFGVFSANEFLSGRVTDSETKSVLNDLLQADYDVPLKINYNQRRKLLDLLLKFYAEHMQHLGEIKSVQVLRELFM